MISHSPDMCKCRASKWQDSSGTDISGSEVLTSTFLGTVLEYNGNLKSARILSMVVVSTDMASYGFHRICGHR